MTKIDILNPKLIVPNDYQQFWVHFEWFLSLFQILDVKQLLSLFKLKVRKNGTFLSQILFLKNFPMVFWSPTPSYAKNWVKLVLKQVFIGGVVYAPPVQQLIAQEPYRSRVKKDILSACLQPLTFLIINAVMQCSKLKVCQIMIIVKPKA